MQEIMLTILLSTLLMTCTLMSHGNAAIDIYQEITAINARLGETMKNVDANQAKLNSVASSIDRLDQHVYFLAFARLATLPSGAIPFGDVRANTGNVYNPNTGVFTTPVAGLYLFTVHTYIKASSRAKLELRVNEQWVLSSMTGYGSDESNQFVYPVYLKAGDKVYVYNTDSPFTIWTYNHTCFSGLLFKAL